MSIFSRRSVGRYHATSAAQHRVDGVEVFGRGEHLGAVDRVRERGAGLA